jgi:5-(carboxyamino)imidazole ribonucleotide synthase
MTALPPGSTIGVLGNGQLGRMMALAAYPLGYRVHIFDPAPGPATQVTPLHTAAAWDDLAALDRFAASVDVVTLEFENVPLAAVAHLATAVPVRPGPTVLGVCQDRIAEKTFLRDAGVPTAPWRPAYDPVQLAAAVADLGDCIAKTARAGYDGKGQVRLSDPLAAEAAWDTLGRPDAVVVEGVVPFRCEVSVIVARGVDGAVASYEPVENVHAHHILRETHVPARIDPATAAAATALAHRIAAALDLTGLVAVELFVLADGGVVVNELAPRPHNSGHWTLDAAACSQFEQAIRAAAGLPLGPTARHHDAVMHNLLGDEVLGAAALLADPAARVHLYGKDSPRPGRKMGHVTWLGKPA